ncbi:hypothetical protein, partial [Streptococcus pneumoniae]|uniref:hypothetical protein n=1 Tax=Streptococcus pneumoniae TaxID=1313 RepID=UPI001954376E
MRRAPDRARRARPGTGPRARAPPEQGPAAQAHGAARPGGSATLGQRRDPQDHAVRGPALSAIPRTYA